MNIEEVQKAFESKGTYQAQGICDNCGYKNYPQWGEYEKGVPKQHALPSVWLQYMEIGYRGRGDRCPKPES